MQTRRLWFFAALAAFAITAIIVLWNMGTVRTTARWFAFSHRYKAEVLSQPASRSGELKHIEWDGWGWAGQDTTVYLVFDPTDALSAPAKSGNSGKFNGLPCEVHLVRRLEKDWYTVQFYTNEWWGRKNALNCSGFGLS
jgi:hypothetical protein